MKKWMKAGLIFIGFDTFYGHLFPIWRLKSPETYEDYMHTKDMLYKKIGIYDKLKKEIDD